MRVIEGKTEIAEKAEKIGRRGRRDTDHEDGDLRVLPTVEAIVMVRVTGLSLFPPFLTKMVKWNSS